jgi:hypothetical protein
LFFKLIDQKNLNSGSSGRNMTWGYMQNKRYFSGIEKDKHVRDRQETQNHWNDKKKKNSADVLLMHLLNKRYSPKTHSDLNHSGENKNKTHSSLSLYFFIFWQYWSLNSGLMLARQVLGSVLFSQAYIGPILVSTLIDIPHHA